MTRDQAIYYAREQVIGINHELAHDFAKALEMYGFKFGDAEKLKPVVSEKHTILDDDVFEFLCSHLRMVSFGGISSHFTLGNRDGNHRTFYKRSSEKAQIILADQAYAEHSEHARKLNNKEHNADLVKDRLKPSMTKAEAYRIVEKLCGREMGKGNIVDALEALGLLTFKN